MVSYYNSTDWGICKARKAKNKVVLNHERIHWEQQKKYGYVGFYLKYMYEAATKGYHNISFKKEAYDNEKDFEYKVK